MKRFYPSMILLAILALPPFTQGAAAQSLEPATDTTSGGGTELMAGGGEDGGGQFPDGTDNCSGDRHHHAHNYPAGRCSMSLNPHYSAYSGDDRSCSQRSKDICACDNCCAKQNIEAKSCYCPTAHCKSLADAAKQKCEQVCFGTYEDVC